MRRLMPWGFGLAFLVVTQTVVGSFVEVYSVKPDFFLISVLILAMRRGAGSAVLWGAILGLVQDALSGGVVGFNFLTKPAVGCVIGLLRPKLDFGNPNSQTLTVLAATLAEGLVLSMLLSAYHPSKEMSWSLSRIFLPEAVYNSLIAPLLIASGDALRAWLEKWRRRQASLVE